MDSVFVLIALAGAFFYALGIVLAPLGLRVAPPVVGGSVSVPSAALFFLILAPFTIDFSSWTQKGALLFMFAGLVFPAMVTLLNFAGNIRLGPNLSGALGNLTPIFAVGAATLLLDDVPGPWQLIGILAVCGGLLLLAAERMRLHSRAALWALTIPLAAAVLRGTMQPVVKLGLESWPDAFAATTIGYVASAVMLITVRRFVSPAPLPRDPRMLWYCVIGVCNGLSVIFLYSALSLGPVTKVAPLVATYPLIVMALNRVIHGDRTLTRLTFIGIAISVAGVALVLSV
ncbi:DMT family transporter [Pseudooceanicola sp.]|uniref:DMT family transporter n=1 Tax=Pseudooceanicola sp. TaxID=1914328 RepID=UPI0026245C96|nr:DMT family transporter [Pseudooceanicola sp.]MDF1854995.1 DMT family transporter [Pseudooceanicola sp.]